MADNVPLTFYEGDLETVAFTITPASATDDLTAVATVRFILKADTCDADEDAEVVLSSAVPAELVLLTQTPDVITGEAYVPPLTEAYPRHYRIDALPASGTGRTAVYGRVTVINL